MAVRGDCVYMQVVVQMYLRGWNSKKLAEETGINYMTLRQKLRGKRTLNLDEMRSIQKALDCGMSMDELFARRDRGN